MSSKNENEEIPLASQSAAHTKQKRRKILLILVILIGVLIIAAVFLLSRNNADETYYTLTGYRYTVIYTTHTPFGNSTITNHMNDETWKVNYQLGSQFYINFPFYNNVSGGTTIVSNVVCDTPGFSFNGSSLPFPFTIPTALNASVNNNNILVRLTFNTPSTPYSGPLVYTAYFEYYP
jgi:hypothetical protein